MEKKIIKLLKDLNVPAGILGYRYLVIAIKKTVEKEGDISGITKELYPGIAKECNTKATRVERAIRHAIEIVFTKADKEALHKYFGPHIEKQTNGNFIATLAYEIIMTEQ